MGTRTRRAPRQGTLAFSEWGGRRKGAGRPPNDRRAGVSHLRRAPLASRFPVHVTLKLKAGLPGLRNRDACRVLRDCFERGRERFGFRLVHYSVLGNHLHLLVEGRDREALKRGMQGLGIRIAKCLNRLWGRRGTVFADRYHDRILRTPREVKNALVYVLRNSHRHGDVGWGPVDSYTSGPWFDGWARGISTRAWSGIVSPVARARTWLLSVGWRKHGRIRLTDLPAG